MINHGADVNARGIVGGMYKKAVDMATSPKCKFIFTNFHKI